MIVILTVAWQVHLTEMNTKHHIVALFLERLCMKHIIQGPRKLLKRYSNG